MQQGGKPASLFSGTPHRLWLYPCSITGATELGYLHLRVRPFNSEVHSASALLPCLHPAVIPDRVAWLSGNRFETYSSSSAFLVFDWRDCMTEGGGCQEEELNQSYVYTNRNHLSNQLGFVVA